MNVLKCQVFMSQEKQITKQHLGSMESRYRARFINSLTGFKSANLVGTVDQQGNPNLAIVSSVVHIGSNPPLIGFINRPNSVERHTLENILATKSFTLNSIDEDIAALAHQTSARYPKNQSEFQAVGLTPYTDNDFIAPFVLESGLKIALTLKEHHIIKANDTELIIGEVEQVRVPSDAIQPDGYLDVESMDLVTISGLDSYHVTQRLYRLDYAKPDKVLEPLSVSGEKTKWKVNQSTMD